MKRLLKMINEYYEKRAYNRHKKRSIAMSDKMYEAILETTGGHISVSAFIRMAVHEKLEKIK